MQIAVIGTGHVGAALGTGWAAKGHTVAFGSRTPERADVQSLTQEAGASADTPEAAARGADVVVLATPWNAAQAAVESLGDLTGTVLIDTTNPIGPGFALVAAPSGAEQVARWASGARVVKAFNTTGWENMADAAYPGSVRPAMFLAGNDAEANAVVAQLAEDLGFDAIDAGPLNRAIHLEHLAMLWITQMATMGAGRDFAFAVLRR